MRWSNEIGFWRLNAVRRGGTTLIQTPPIPPMIDIVPCRAAWPQEFRLIGAGLRATLGTPVLRINHIGSTSVPGLAAKDLIDLQFTVGDFETEVSHALEESGNRRLPHLADHIPPGNLGAASDWQKWVLIEPPGMRRLNLHVGQAGRANQRNALLFRDYLRTHPLAASHTRKLSVPWSRLHPPDKDAYYEVKDPVCDIIMQGAEALGGAAGWKPAACDGLTAVREKTMRDTLAYLQDHATEILNDVERLVRLEVAFAGPGTR